MSHMLCWRWKGQKTQPLSSGNSQPRVETERARAIPKQELKCPKASLETQGCFLEEEVSKTRAEGEQKKGVWRIWAERVVRVVILKVLIPLGFSTLDSTDVPESPFQMLKNRHYYLHLSGCVEFTFFSWILLLKTLSANSTLPARSWMRVGQERCQGADLGRHSLLGACNLLP